jgi:hypothetical protein
MYGSRLRMQGTEPEIINKFTASPDLAFAKIFTRQPLTGIVIVFSIFVFHHLKILNIPNESPCS